MDSKNNARGGEIIMGAGTGIGSAVGTFFFGAILVVVLAAWDYLIYGMNILTTMGYQTQDALNAFGMLTIMINGLGIVFIFALFLNFIIQGKNQSEGNV
jgi:hypothetical protein